MNKDQRRDRIYNEEATVDSMTFEPRPIQGSADSIVGRDQSAPASDPAPAPAPAPVRTTSDSVRTNTCAAVKRYIEVDKKGKNHPIIVVQHNYHDHSHENEADHEPQKFKSRGGVAIPFPLKLHGMLEKAMAEGHGDVVSWQPHGRCFVVHKPQEFQEIVLPMYFKLTKLSSFQRQLNLYGFQRLTLGRDRGGYYHELFLQNKPFLARDMQRVQVKGTRVRARSNPDQEPNFWTMQWCEPRVTTVSSDDESEGSSIDSRRKNKSIPPEERRNLVTSNRIAFGVPILDQIQPMRHQSTMIHMGGANHAISKYIIPKGHTSYRRSSSDKIEGDDLVFSFGNKTFYYLDPFQPLFLDPKKNDNNEEIVSDDVFYAETFAHLLS